MFHHAKNGLLRLGSRTMDYISYGTGPDVIIMIPGLGDGLRTVKGTAAGFAMLYEDFARNHTVYAFSRINELEEGYTTADMARDIIEAMDSLGIEKADIIGVSQGGMIAQHLSLLAPERVRKLVLTVTSAHCNPLIEQNVNRWMAMAKEKRYHDLMVDTSENMYTGKYLEKARKTYPLLNFVGKPKAFTRFLIEAQSCKDHDALEQLQNIACPVLVLGGELDRVVGPDASREIAARIPGAQLHMYPSLGHGLYEETKDWSARILAFFSEEADAGEGTDAAS